MVAARDWRVPRPLTHDRIEALWGCPVLDRDGRRVGSLQEVFYDAADIEPEWIAVGTGPLGRRLVLAPARGATEVCFSIALPCAAELVAGAPELLHDRLDEQTRQALRSHFADATTVRAGDTSVSSAYDSECNSTLLLPT